MFKHMSLAFLASASLVSAASTPAMAIDASAALPEPTVLYASPLPQPAAAPVRVAYNERSNMGGGLIEAIFSDGMQGGSQPRYQVPQTAQPQLQSRQYRQQYPQQQYQQQVQPQYEPQQAYQQPQYQQPQLFQPFQPLFQQPQAVDPGGYEQQQRAMRAPDQDVGDPTRPAMDPKYEKQMVMYSGKERAGTIVVDTPNKFLYLVQENGRALRYGIGVGRPGFTWSGVKSVSAKKEWPSWTPPKEMLARRPDLPRFMEGGKDNPLGARAMYLGSSLYRIHGSNEPWTIGTNVSSGCIRMRNEDVIDLYGRVNVGARVVVI